MLCLYILGRYVPCVDGSQLASQNFTSRCWSVQPCVRPVSVVRMTAGHNALRGSGPGQKPAFKGCDGTCGLSRSPDRPALHYVLFALPTFNITPDDQRDLVHAARPTGSL
jgi:hypothetical protein